MTKTLGILGFVLVTIFSLPSRTQAVCPTGSVPHTNGEWRTLPYLMPISPISATLLRNGKVLIVSGSEYNFANYDGDNGSYLYGVWDPTNLSSLSFSEQHVSYDVFCSGVTTLADGRALAVGGTSSYVFTGDYRSSLFDPVTGAFPQLQNMSDGRWYGSPVQLGDNRVMVFSGIRSTQGSTNNTVEIYNPMVPGAGWTAPVSSPFNPALFPHLFLLPNGRVFYTGQGYDAAPGYAWTFNPSGQTWTRGAPISLDRHSGSAVLLPLLPPNYTPRIMNFGGGSPATSSTEIIDLSATSPAWTAGPNMSTGRIQMDAILLPNGKVLAEGGSLNDEVADAAGRNADLYNPVTNTFSPAGTASFSRLYHSNALLLPDATVAIMGSDPQENGYEPRIEIYRPPYLFDANDNLITTNRPTINSVSSNVISFGASFSVNYTAVSAISSVVLMHLGSATHAFDFDQRLVGLCGPSPQPACNAGAGTGTLSLTSPPNGYIAPPGYYMLFVLDTNGVPSVAKIIQLSSFSTVPPTSIIALPASDATITAGQSVYFSTNTAAAQYSWVIPGGSSTVSTNQAPGNVTFNSPGTYVTSLTVTDASGNSDPSPPVRTITVLPTTPSFNLMVTALASTVLPGQSTGFLVTVTPIAGFNSTVNLTVKSSVNFPSSITGSFNPSSIVGGSGTSTLTMSTTASALPGAVDLTITGTSGTLSRNAAATLLVAMPAPSNLTATAGSGQVSLSFSGVTGASQYEIKRGLVTGGPYQTLACTSTNTYVDTAVANNTTYYYVVTADYASGFAAIGSGSSAASSEVSATLGTTGASQTISFTSTAPTSATVGGPTYSVSASATSGLPVTFSSATTNVCRSSGTNGSTISFVGAGTCTINANQGGNTTYNAAPQVQQNFTVSAGTQTITFTSTAPSSARVGGSTYTATATATSGLAVTFTSATTSVCTSSGTNGSVFTFVGAGTCTINANQAGNASYSAAPQVQQSFTVAPPLASQTITFTSSAPTSAVVGGPTYTVSASATSGLPVTFTSATTSVCTSSGTNGSIFTFVGTGTCTINANQAGNASYNAAPQVQQSFTVAAAPLQPPTNFVATTGSIATRINLTWVQSASPNIKKNFIYRRTATGTYPQTPTITTNAKLSYQDTGLISGATYCYVITAANAKVESPPSAETCAKSK